MLAITAYDGHKVTLEGHPESGYLAISEGDKVAVRRIDPVAGHSRNRYRNYVYANDSKGMSGWVPASAVTPYSDAI